MEISTVRDVLNPTWPAASFFHTVGKELEVDVSRSSAYSALKIVRGARENAEENLEDQYRYLYDLKKSSLGQIQALHVK